MLSPIINSSPHISLPAMRFNNKTERKIWQTCISPTLHKLVGQSDALAERDPLPLSLFTCATTYSGVTVRNEKYQFPSWAAYEMEHSFSAVVLNAWKRVKNLWLLIVLLLEPYHMSYLFAISAQLTYIRPLSSAWACLLMPWRLK